MMQFFNFIMSALNDPMAAGTQMALEGVSPDMLGSAMNPESQKTLGMMMQPGQDQMQQPVSQHQQVQDAVYRPGEGQQPQVVNAGAESNQLMQRFQSAIMQGNPDRGVLGLSNPNAIAAVMATGKHESAFSPGNVYGSWNDPSEGGVAGTSGGVLSWREGRYKNLLAYGGKDTPPEIETQGHFFLEENPQLIRQLEAAKTPEEAQTLMNNAWAFAGYDKAGNAEVGDRINTAKLFAGGDMSLGAPMGQGGVGSDIVAGQQAATDDGRYTTADMAADGENTMATLSASTDAGAAGAGVEQSRAKSLANKIAQIGKGLKVPERQPVEAPRITGGLQPQVGGAYNPADLGQMFALLGGQGPKQGLPPLSQLIRGG